MNVVLKNEKWALVLKKFWSRVSPNLTSLHVFHLSLWLSAFQVHLMSLIGLLCLSPTKRFALFSLNSTEYIVWGKDEEWQSLTEEEITFTDSNWPRITPKNATSCYKPISAWWFQHFVDIYYLWLLSNCWLFHQMLTTVCTCVCALLCMDIHTCTNMHILLWVWCVEKYII